MVLFRLNAVLNLLNRLSARNKIKANFRYHYNSIWTLDYQFTTACLILVYTMLKLAIVSHKKWRGIMLYPPNFECPSVRPSVRPSSVRPSFRPSVRQRFVSVLYFSTFWPIFFKLCIDIGIGEEMVWDCKWANFVLKQQSYGPWCMSKMLCASFPCS